MHIYKAQKTSKVGEVSCCHGDITGRDNIRRGGTPVHRLNTLRCTGGYRQPDHSVHRGTTSITRNESYIMQYGRARHATFIAVTTRMWTNAQPDGRPAEHRWRPLFNAAKFG